MATPDHGNMDLSDEDTSDLFASPSRLASKAKERANAKKAEQASSAAAPPPTTQTKQQNGESRFDAGEAREAALQRELEGVRGINSVIENAISSLETAKGNMGNVSRTVSSASTLLNTWTRILSQTEHNQRLILNPNWQGASADLADMENEVILKAQAAERRAAEEERRREEARRKAEEEERQRQAGTATRGVRGTRGRGRGTGRGTSSTSSNYVGVGGQGGVSGTGRITPARTRSSAGTGRGTGTRGRARGIR